MPQNGDYWGICCLFVLVDFFMPLASICIIRPQLRSGETEWECPACNADLGNVIVIELCSGLFCAPCAMNNARIEYMGTPTVGLLEY